MVATILRQYDAGIWHLSWRIVSSSRLGISSKWSSTKRFLNALDNTWNMNFHQNNDLITEHKSVKMFILTPYEIFRIFMRVNTNITFTITNIEESNNFDCTYWMMCITNVGCILLICRSRKLRISNECCLKTNKLQIMELTHTQKQDSFFLCCAKVSHLFHTFRPPYWPGGFWVAKSMNFGWAATTSWVSGMNNSLLSSRSYGGRKSKRKQFSHDHCY